MASTFSGASLQVVSGATTVWLPISTPWLSIAACSSQIYAQRAGLGGNFIAFDPLYGESIVPSAIPCLPTEVSSSWFQSDSATTTILGPTFMCPGAYSAVKTIVVDSLTQQVLCCPSQYTLNVPITGHGSFPSQCISSFTPSQTITYESTTPSGPWGVATTVVAASTASTTGPSIVWGMHVNGFNVIAAVRTSGATTSESSNPTTSNTPSASDEGHFPASTSTANASLSTGATSGITVASTLAVTAAIAGAWFMFWRRRQKKVSGYVGAMREEEPKDPQEMEVPNRSHELPDNNGEKAPRNTVIHEMGVS